MALYKVDERPVSQRLLVIGEKLYRFGRRGLQTFPLAIGFSLFFFLMQFVFGGDSKDFIKALSFVANRYAALQTLGALIFYLGWLFVLIGIPFFFIGLHYLGLGQIAENTEKPAVITASAPVNGTAVSSAAADEELPEL